MNFVAKYVASKYLYLCFRFAVNSPADVRSSVSNVNASKHSLTTSGLLHDCFLIKCDLSSFLDKVQRSSAVGFWCFLVSVQFVFFSFPRRNSVRVLRLNLNRHQSVCAKYSSFCFCFCLHMHHGSGRSGPWHTRCWGKVCFGVCLSDMYFVFCFEICGAGVLVAGGFSHICASEGVTRGSPGSPGIASVVLIVLQMKNQSAMQMESFLWVFRVRARVFRWVNDIYMICQYLYAFRVVGQSGDFSKVRKKWIDQVWGIYFSSWIERGGSYYLCWLLHECCFSYW